MYTTTHNLGGARPSASSTTAHGDRLRRDRRSAWVDATALVVGLIALVVAVFVGDISPAGAALLVAGACSVGLAAHVDARSLRLPNALTLPALAAGVLAGVVDDRVAAAATGAVLVALPFLAVHLIDPAGMGFGDVKAAAASGALAGAVVPTVGPLLVVIAVLVGVMLLRLRRSDGARALGPAIVAGSGVGLLAAAMLQHAEVVA